MITIFNRREVCVETDPGRFAGVRNRLSAAGIPYVYASGGTTREAGLRGTMGSFGAGNVSVYTLYVHKRDYDRAMCCLRKGN